ncbi:CDP-6-deoxy-L-threo-D-glycero-4-hexulose-3-dehydrase reductase [Burkholderiales bacterium]|nr:CDP-6-deoxy-L-threo-D-glycero-4-hexulose-3-dehydrase reductase [Burkholderiales bacterium]
MTSHKVLVQPSGREFSVPSKQTVLAAALHVGITLPHGCRNGACGSCKGKVLSGHVQHGPHTEAALSAEEEAAGLALFCCAHPQTDLVIEARIAAAVDGVVPRKMPARIEHIEWAAKDVAILSLKLPASEHLLYRAGQYVDFILPHGVRRSYSIASMPGEGGPIEFHIRHMVGGTFTDALFDLAAPTVKERGILRLEGPLGTFFLREADSKPIVLLASGTGFAPIKAIAETIFAKGLHRDDPATGRRARPVVLYWGARTRADLYLDALPRRWEDEQPNFRYVPVLSDPDSDIPASDAQSAASREPVWTGRTGLVHQAVMVDLPDLSGFQVYACGVPIMVQSAHRDFVAHCGMREEDFFSDAFVSKADLPAAGA